MTNTLHTKQNTLNTLNSVGTTTLAMGKVYTTNTTAGQFLTSGSNGTTWANPNYSMGDNVLTVNGTDASLTVKGKMILNGQDLEERLKTIERVLMIPERDLKMEAKYPSLKKKFDQYINALEKYKTFERIKGDYDN